MGKMLKRLLDWTPIAVEKPVEVKDKNGMVKGYQVVITYLYQGKRSKFFGNDCQAWYHLYGSPQNAANVFYIRLMDRALKWQYAAARLFQNGK